MSQAIFSGLGLGACIAALLHKQVLRVQDPGSGFSGADCRVELY